jgi:hypothetical protein
MPVRNLSNRLVTAVGRSLLHVGCTPFLVPRTGQLAVMRNGGGSWYQRATERRLSWTAVYCAITGAFWITIGSLQLAVHGGGLLGWGWLLLGVLTWLIGATALLAARQRRR